MQDQLYKLLPLLIPVIFVIIWKCVWKTKTYPRNLPYPPGPKPLPIVGNLYDVTNDQQWLRLNDLSNRYGDVLFLRVFGQPMVVLGSAASANDLLERRSAIYSDRLPAAMVSLMGWDWNIGLMPYGSWWRAHRRGFNQYFNQNAVARYIPIQEQQLLKFLRALLADPSDFLNLTRFAFGASIFKVAYGIEVDDPSDKYLRLAEESLEALVEGMIPGSFWVDFLPILKYIPAWMPGAGFQRKASKWKTIATGTKEVPFAAARIARDNGHASDSVAERMMSKLQTEHDEEIAKNVSGIGFAGGSHTSMSTAQTFFFAMAAYPEIQKKAQKELDSVIGEHRLPLYADRASLPYINAILNECFRWQPVVPLGLAHRSSADDEYRGWYIPKGTIVVVNQWTLLHDPQTYPDPEKFYPDRFIKDGQLNPLVKDSKTVAFGFGRRICPGRFFADNGLFLTIASVLHLFTIAPPLDERGQPIQLQMKMTSGALSYPEPFKCIIRPRSAAKAALIDQTNV